MLRAQMVKLVPKNNDDGLPTEAVLLVFQLDKLKIAIMQRRMQ